MKDQKSNNNSLTAAFDAKNVLTAKITALVEAFEDTYGLTVNGMTVFESRKGLPNRIDMRVSLETTKPATRDGGEK